MVQVGKGRRMLVLPGCCEESRAALRPYIRLDYGPSLDYIEDPNNAIPKWHIPHIDYDTVREILPFRADPDTKYSYVNRAFYYSNTIPVRFCPYCGEELPHIVMKDRPPKGVCLDDDSHCGNCNQRKMCCNCKPQTILFKPVRRKK